MAASVEEKTRAALIWGGLGVLIAAGFFVTVAILNSTVYSAPGFVRSYVDALNRGDTESALSMAGVQATGSSGDELLTVSEKGRLHRINEVADHSLANGARRVTVTFDTGTGSATQTLTTRFSVRRVGTFAGLFGRWEFTVAPTASLDVTPQHDPGFTANGRDVTAKSADLATRYTVLAPAVFSLSHDSTYLMADPTTAVVATVGGVESASVDVEPRQSFVDKVRSEVTRYLRTDCVPQKVLLPSGCPFGDEIDDRLTSTPSWTMTTYPRVSLEPTTTADVWRVADATGTAHLSVKAQSLYDGHDYSIDKDVPFDVEYLVSIGADDRLTITPK